MKDLKHYFSSPKDSGKSDQSSVSVDSPEWTAESRSSNCEGSLKITLALKGKKKKKRKNSIDNLKETNALPIEVHSSPEDECQPVKKKRKCDEKSLANETTVISSSLSVKTEAKTVYDDSVIAAINGKEKSLQSRKKKRKAKNEIIKSTSLDECNDSRNNEHSSMIVNDNGLNETLREEVRRNSITKFVPTDLNDCNEHSPIDSSGSGVADCNQEELVNGGLKKKSKKAKKPKKRKKLEEDFIVSNGKENNLSKQSPKLDSSLETNGKFTPSTDVKNKILNYFNKVDKLPELSQQRVSVLKVEAIIHSPPTGKPKISKVTPKQKIKMKRRNISAELDLITSEEDNTILENSPQKLQTGKSWKMRVQLSKSIESETEDSLSSILSVPGTKDLSGDTMSVKKECTENLKSDVGVLKEDNAKPNNVKNQSTEDNGKASESDEDIEIISEEKMSQVSLPKPARIPRGNGTLTSFFTVKSQTKVQNNALSEERLAAKQQFLESGTPENMKKLFKTRACGASLGNPAPFPKYSHVRQKDIMNVVWNLPKISFACDPRNLRSEVFETDWSISVKREKNHSKSLKCDTPFTAVENIKHSIKKLKKESEGFPISVWYKQMKEMKKNNEGEMWNEKFKPTILEHFIDNRRNIEKFKSWLENYRIHSKTGPDDSSGDEFTNSENESKQVQNIALLVGPNGSGKTSVVYAIASQLGYQVLELNAACNRAGKRLLLEFSEATQSHKLKVSSNFFSNKKKKKEENERTLLLLEDADLVFQDFDEGFLSAVNYLMLSAKRPVVLIANDDNCKHLNKFIPNCQLHLKFISPEPRKLSSWLRTLSLTEGVSMNEFDSTELAEVSNGDVRQALLQLQFCFSPKLSRKQLFSRRQPNIKRIWERAGEYDIRKKKELMKMRRVMRALTTADVISRGIVMHDKSVENGPRFWDRGLKDSTSIAEVFCPPPDILGATIVEELEDRTDSVTSTIANLDTTLSSTIEATRKVLMNGELEGGISCWSVLSRRSVATDYLSAMRKIAISEQSRLANQTKRNNRYFNYLQSTGFNLTEPLLNVLTTAFADTKLVDNVPSHIPP